MSRSSNRSLGVGHSPGIKSNGLRSSWPSPRGSRSDRWPSAPNAIRRLSGGSAVALRTRACPISWNHPNGPGDRPGFPPCNVHRSFNWPAWSQSPRACTSPTGRARIWPAKRSKMDRPGHQRSDGPSDPQSGGPPAASHAVLADVSHRHSLQGACRSDPLVPRQRRAVGPAGLLVVCAVRNPTSKSWNVIPSGIRSPARSRSVVRLHAARHGQHPVLPDRSQRTDGGGVLRREAPSTTSRS